MNNGPALLQKYAPLLSWVIVVSACICIAFKVLSYGYVPIGDARRYVAKAVTDKEYPQILVMGPTYQMDFSPGWEWLLRRLHRVGNVSEDGLMQFSVAGLLLLILCGALPLLRHPEAWLAALLAVTVPFPGLMSRFTQARPFLLTEGVLICVLLAWALERTPTLSWWKIIGSVAGFALAAWIHGTWYLYGLVLAAFFLAGWWRETIYLTLCWLAGTALGAALTGAPIEFLKQNLLWGAALYKEPVATASLVGELQPSAGEFSALLVLGFVWLWRKQQRRGEPDLFRSPLFWLMALCWILALKAGRFWADWGLAAAMVWLAAQFDDSMKLWWDNAPGRRLAGCCLLAVPLFLDTTSDLDSRYSRSLHEAFADGSRADMKGWMPDDGGIFYSADFSFFFNTFYKNPDGNWRYLLGYEPAIMPEDDLKIFRNIQWNQYAWEAYRPWVDKMRPQDRLEITGNGEPILPPLQWHHAGGAIWIGRLPPKN
ncbi:MAG TPA: hypothetical protein VMR33_22680 [Candidatus Baltobacteraceae bacterium]|jgi:hypothetical protein|nr:hypothetical protein [Candidatus Baltobacteraceae bacterium]